MTIGATFSVLVDWNRDGLFTGTYDDITSRVINMSFNVGFRQPYTDTADEMTATFTLTNTDKRFSPDYASGPLYTSKWLLRPVKIVASAQVVDGSGNPVVDGSGNFVVAEYVLWRGWTTMVRPDWNTHGQKRAILTASGPRQFLQSAQVFIPLQQEKRSDEIITAILDEVRIPPAVANGPWVLGVPGYSEIGTTTYLQNPAVSYSLEVGRETFDYAADTWMDGITAIEAIDATVKAERGRFFYNRDGTCVFWNRHHLMLKASADATLSDNFMGATYGFGDHLANVVNVTYNPRTVDSSSTTLWSMSDPLRILRRETKEIRARFSEQDSDSKVSAIDVVTPNTVDGSLAFSSGTAQLTQWKQDAKGARFTLVPQGNAACTVSLIQIAGRRLTAYNETEVRVQDGAERFYNGERTLTLNLDMLNDTDTAQRIAAYELARRKTPKGEIQTLTIRAVDDTRSGLMLNLTIGSRVTITETQTGSSADYFIVGEQHTVTEALTVHDVTWTLEPASSQAFWILGVSTLGETTVLAPI